MADSAITEEMVEKAMIAYAEASRSFVLASDIRAALEAVLPDIERAVRERVRKEERERRYNYDVR